MCCGTFFRCVPISLGLFPVINGRGLPYPFLLSHPHPPSIPLHRSARNTAFNRSLVYRGTLTLHLLIASVMAFLGFDANLLGRPCDFGKSSREYLISYPPVTLSRSTRVYTRARTWARGYKRTRYKRWSACSPGDPGIVGFSATSAGITSREISPSPRVRCKNERHAIILRINVQRAAQLTGRL